jgi:hypothetical protein
MTIFMAYLVSNSFKSGGKFANARLGGVVESLFEYLKTAGVVKEMALQRGSEEAALQHLRSVMF